MRSSSSIGCLAAALNQAGDLFTLATTQNQAMPHQDQAGSATKQPRQKYHPRFKLGLKNIFACTRVGLAGG